MANMIACPICGASAEELETTGDFANILCPQCDNYGISRNVDIGALRELEPAQRRLRLEKAKRSAQSGKRPIITSYSLQKRTFIAATMPEANRQANEWLAEHKEYRQIHRTQVAVSGRGPALADADQCAVSIYYETEKLS